MWNPYRRKVGKEVSEEQATINDLQVSLMRAQEEADRLRKAIQRIEEVVVEEAKLPRYHSGVIERHRLEWGSLHNAIEKAIEALHGR